MNEKRQNNKKKPEENLDISSRNSGEPILKDRPARPHPSEAKAKDISKAKRILKRNIFAPVTEKNATSKEEFLIFQEDLKWAKALLPHFIKEFRAEKRAQRLAIRESRTAKRQMRVQDSLSDMNPSDKVVVHAHNAPPIANSRSQQQSSELKHATPNENPAKRSYVDIVRGRQIIGLIDRGNVEGKIPRDQWDWIQASVASVVLEVVRDNPGPPPSCTDAGWFQGSIKLIACDNHRSGYLYGRAIAKVGEVYPGAQLEVVGIKDIPFRPWGTAWLPENPSESAEILEMLSSLNPDLPMQDWKVIKADRFERDMMLVIFQINHLSIEHLTRCGGLLNYASNKIRMQFYKCPQDALSNLEAFSAAVDPPSEEAVEELEIAEDSSDLALLFDYADSLD